MLQENEDEIQAENAAERAEVYERYLFYRQNLLDMKADVARIEYVEKPDGEAF